MTTPRSVPSLRVRALGSGTLRPSCEWVLYWMTAFRRPRFNFALQHAVECAAALGRPLMVVEALYCAHPWASDRFHAFVLQGMNANARAFADKPVRYVPYAEPAAGEAAALLEALASRAALVITDEYPASFHTTIAAAAVEAIDVRVEAVDSNGLLPMRAAAGRVFTTALSFRAFLQRTLPAQLDAFAREDPFEGQSLAAPPALPDTVAARWPPATDALLAARSEALAALPIDHGVAPVAIAGGASAAGRTLEEFLRDRLPRYPKDRNQPERDASSGLSPYLHFGHLSAHEIFAALMTREKWTRRQLGRSAGGKREGWWGVSEAADAFLDQLVTWRELGFNMSAHRDDHDRYESLPGWARATLEAHAADPRPTLYSRAELEAGATHDPLWNAAQMQLVREGRLHNYLRMLWGKKILEWSESPRAALDAMIHLNDKYALDGRDPNSYSGIFWCLGRYDRPWGPERPIFGTVRYMSSANTARKVSVKHYVRRYAPDGATLF